MADAVEAARTCRVDWFNEVMGKILKVKDYQKLAHTANLIKERMEEGPSKTAKYSGGIAEADGG